MPSLHFERTRAAALRTDVITRRMQHRLALRQLHARPARRAFNTLASWARSGASVINACRAAASAWSSL